MTPEGLRVHRQRVKLESGFGAPDKIFNLAPVAFGAMTQEHRRLSAIVFTDIVGYSAFSERNESLAMRLLDTHNSLVRRVMERHGGREVKTIGDSFLLEFPSALEAVRFAIEAQDEFGRSPQEGPSGETISVRIGVHVGDVISRDGDLFGDAVNIASRIVEVAQGGEVCISGNVYDQVRNKVRVGMEKLPSQSLRGIESKVDLYVMVPQAEASFEGPTPNPANRIAVLPFANISPDPNDGYFAEGLTEELISELSGVQGLRVIARTSVERYKAAPKNARQIGAELKVSHLLEGSVRKAGNRIRVTAHLVDTESQEEVWSDR
jgi:adenylate cyclase